MQDLLWLFYKYIKGFVNISSNRIMLSCSETFYNISKIFNWYMLHLSKCPKRLIIDHHKYSLLYVAYLSHVTSARKQPFPIKTQLGSVKEKI